MDPLQMQNPQQVQVMPPQMPPQIMPVQPTIPQQAAPASEGVFDKIIKGIISVIAKLSGQPDPITGQGGQAVAIQPGQQTIQGQVPQTAAAPQGGLMAGMGNLLSGLGNGLEGLANTTVGAVSTTVQGATNYINQPAPTQTPTITPQEFMQQNYQQVPPQIAPTTPAQQAVAPAPVAPVVQQAPVAPQQ